MQYQNMSSSRGVDVCKWGPEFYLIGHLEYDGKSNTEFRDYFMCVHMIFLSFNIISKTWGTAASSENM